MIETCQGPTAHGFRNPIINMPNFHEIEPIERIGREVIPEVGGL